MKKCLFTGVATALATPFNDNGINILEFKKFIDFQITAGINALVVCGTTGESCTMTQEEKIQAIQCAVSTSNKRVPIIVGTGSNDTATAIINSILAEELGADGLLLVTPYYNKTTQAGLIEHFKAIASSVSLPIILYNVPSRTGMNIFPETCYELSKINNIIGIKEASGNISQVAKIAQFCGDNFSIYSGNDDQIVPVLSLGGKGVISVLSNIKPELTCSITNSFFKKATDEACYYQLQALPLVEALFAETNPIPVKSAINMLGFDFGAPRLPLIECSSVLKENLHKYLPELDNRT